MHFNKGVEISENLKIKKLKVIKDIFRSNQGVLCFN